MGVKLACSLSFCSLQSSAAGRQRGCCSVDHAIVALGGDDTAGHVDHAIIALGGDTTAGHVDHAIVALWDDTTAGHVVHAIVVSGTGGKARMQ